MQRKGLIENPASLGKGELDVATNEREAKGEFDVETNKREAKGANLMWQPIRDTHRQNTVSIMAAHSMKHAMYLLEIPKNCLIGIEPVQMRSLSTSLQHSLRYIASDHSRGFPL